MVAMIGRATYGLPRPPAWTQPTLQLSLQSFGTEGLLSREDLEAMILLDGKIRRTLETSRKAKRAGVLER